GYSGGGGDGGGGSGGGEGAAVIVRLLIWLIIRHPVVGIPVTIGAVVIFIYAQKKGTESYQGHVIRQGNSARDALQAMDAIAKLKARDASFDDNEFLARVRKAFAVSQDAWCSHKLDAIRPFVSDSIYERWLLQINEQKDLGYRDTMSNVNISSVRMVQLVSDEPFDVMTVRINASAVDYRVSIKDGKRISGSTSARAFVEYWSFIRRVGVQSKAGQVGLMEGNCPNCGAAIEMNQAAECKHCGALLRSGEYDWVLAEITQGCEWKGGSPHDIPGADTVKLTDKEFNIQHLEDRASVMFWRRAMSDRAGSVDALRNVSSPQFAEACAKYLRDDDARGKRSYFGECAVGSVDTIGILVDDKTQKALVEVRWSGTRFTVEKSGKAKSTGEKRVFRSLFVLERDAGAKSAAKDAVSSAHCPSCGAPESGGASGKCEYCGAILNDGSRDWVLADAPSWATSEAQSMLRTLREQKVRKATTGRSVESTVEVAGVEVLPSGAAMVAWIVKMMLADQVIDEKEREMLNAVAANHNIPQELFEAMIASAMSGEAQVPEPASREEAWKWLIAMARMALADGSIQSAEYEMLMEAGGKLGMSDYDVKAMIKRERANLYREAKERVKTQKARVRKAQG
ncbi:MAG: TIM44-like domain-containing protein, partial [Planctomycetes bacterium]|nr:TIM44-like domain-containing protein [Planctomycetota bacterium]